MYTLSYLITNYNIIITILLPHLYLSYITKVRRTLPVTCLHLLVVKYPVIFICAIRWLIIIDFKSSSVEFFPVSVVKGKEWPCPGGLLISLTWALSLQVDKPQSLWHGQCVARPTVTFPASERYCRLTGTKLYCLLSSLSNTRRPAGQELWPMDREVLLFRILLSGTLCHRPCVYRPLRSDSFRVE